MAVIAIRCRCGNTHRIECSKTAAAAWPRPRRGDCLSPPGSGARNRSEPDPACVELQPQPVSAALALALSA